MPALGADMTEGTLTEWLVKPGDTVRRGDTVAVIDTDKAAIEVEVFADGVVSRLLVEPGTKVPVGTVLAEIDGAATTPSPTTTPSSTVSTSPSTTTTPPAPAVMSPPVRHLAHVKGVDLAALAGTGPGGSITRRDVELATRSETPASPRAKRLARQRGVDLAGVVGTGPRGTITGADIERIASAPPAAPAESQPGSGAGHADAKPVTNKLAAMRAATATLMARSKREIPHYYLSTTIDLSVTAEWLVRTNAGRPVSERMVVAAPMLKAAALAAQRVPELNGFWVDDAFHPSHHVHLGVAVSLRGGGLVAPAILDADQLSLDALMQQLRDLVARTRAGRLRQREMGSATLTVTNLGDNGAEAVYGVIYPPQVALIGLGRVIDRPIAVAGLVGARPSVAVTLSGDHRATDGHVGSRYLQAFAELLATPEEL